MGTLYGADDRSTPSISVPTRLLEQFDELVEESNRWDNRAEAVREFMRDAVDGERGVDEPTPLRPPAEAVLADAYRRLCRAAFPDGFVREAVACRLVAQGPNPFSADDVVADVMHPLRQRGYLQRQSDLYDPGKFTSWRIVGWRRSRPVSER